MAWAQKSTSPGPLGSKSKLKVSCFHFHAERDGVLRPKTLKCQQNLTFSMKGGPEAKFQLCPRLASQQAGFEGFPSRTSVGECAQDLSPRKGFSGQD